VRGIEGSDVARPGRPTAFAADGPLELPEELGQRLPSEGGAQVSATATRAVLAGELNGAVEQAVALSAALRLYAAGLCEEPRAGLERGRAALRDGSAAAVLDAMVG
jgi:anthranilate phosphoribosyltransferase